MAAFLPAPCSLLARPRSKLISAPRRPRLLHHRRAPAASPTHIHISAEYPEAAPQSPLRQIDHASTEQLLRTLDETPFPPSLQLIREMVDHLADSRGLKRLALVDNFGRIGSPAVPSLMDALQHSPNPVIRRSSGKALAKIGDPQATPILLDVLVRDPDTVTRSSAAGALAKMGPSAVPSILTLIANPDVPMTAKGHAAWALAFMSGGDETAKALLNAAESPNDDVRLAVVSALGAVAIGDSLPVMGVPDSPGGVAVADSLSGLDSGKSAADDQWDPEEGDADAETKSRALATLRFMLNDSSSEVRAEAATALANAGCADDAAAIASLLEDSDAELRRCAALSLMKLGDASFAPVLRKKADDKSELDDVRRVAQLAASSLERMAGRDGGDDDW